MSTSGLARRVACPHGRSRVGRRHPQRPYTSVAGSRCPPTDLQADNPLDGCADSTFIRLRRTGRSWFARATAERTNPRRPTSSGCARSNGRRGRRMPAGIIEPRSPAPSEKVAGGHEGSEATYTAVGPEHASSSCQTPSCSRRRGSSPPPPGAIDGVDHRPTKGRIQTAGCAAHLGHLPLTRSFFDLLRPSAR